MTEFSFMHWVIVAALGYVFWRFFKSNTPAGGAKAAPPRQLNATPAFTWPARDEYEFEVTGESHYQRTLQRLAGEHGDDAAQLITTAVVVPDDANPHDDKAVAVLIDGHQVGHLSRDDARSYRRRLAAKKQGMVAAQCGAVVMGGFIRRDGTRASYGVRLDLKPFE
ncbi:MAG: HIRAN domain-containing protein [Acidovorax temperans]|uniref:HIRAN domain-containing protein n=1 Tax=Acidovorax temperans TaxID=80878 RepID=UPI00391D2A20